MCKERKKEQDKQEYYRKYVNVLLIREIEQQSLEKELLLFPFVHIHYM